MLSPGQQAEVVRSNQKDDYYLTYVRAALGDVVHSWLGPRIWMKWRKELDLAADVSYFALTTLGGFQTLGEEYVNIIQVDPTRRAIPSTLRRTLMIGLQVVSPYVVDRLLVYCERQLRENPAVRLSAPARGRLLQALPVLRYAVTLLHRCHLVAFYLSGTFYHLAKRLTGIHYLRVRRGEMGSSLVYKVLGWLSLLQLSLTFLRQLYTCHKDQQRAQHGTTDITSYTKPTDSTHGDPDPLSGPARHRCALCLETRTQTTATPCGHLFCWPCIHEWCANKAECPLCRQPCQSSRLLFLQNYDVG